MNPRLRGRGSTVSNEQGPRLLGSIVSAGFGLIALIACVGVVVLTDDDLGVDVVSTEVPDLGGLSPQVPEGLDDDSSEDSPNGSAESGAGAAPEGADPTECTETECPGTGEPTSDAGIFPYPPGATEPDWTDDYCADIYAPVGTTVRQVRGSLDEVRDFYLRSLTANGYGWGPDQVRANPFREKDDGTRVVLGWDATLLVGSEDFGGRLSLEHGHEAQTVCGPPVGVVYITVKQP